MAHVSKLPRWLTSSDELVPTDAILVLDGAEIRQRFFAGLSLLRQGYAPRLLVSLSAYGTSGHLEAETQEMVQAGSIHWLHNRAVSTREEAIEARRTLQRLKCASVLVVTSSYHTRRVRQIYAREFATAGIQVRIFAVPVTNFNEDVWWKSQPGRALVLFESAKLLATWLHVDPPISADIRHRLKLRVLSLIP